MTVAAITGGARGIGRAIAEALAAEGMLVAIGDIDVELSKRTAAAIPGAVGLPLDVADPEAFDAFLDDAEAALGPIAILVNNAGIMPIGPFLDQDVALARRAVDVNLHGVLNGIRAALPRMVGRGGGHIVNIASVAGRTAVPGGALYSATKHAVVGLSDGIRQEFRAAGIRVSTVLPSFTNTELIAGTTGLRGVPNVEPADVASAVLKAIKRNRSTVYVPRMLRTMVWLHDSLPARVNDAVTKLLGGDRVFLEVDTAQRQSYSDRIRRKP